MRIWISKSLFCTNFGGDMISYYNILVAAKCSVCFVLIWPEALRGPWASAAAERHLAVPYDRCLSHVVVYTSGLTSDVCSQVVQVKHVKIKAGLCASVSTREPLKVMNNIFTSTLMVQWHTSSRAKGLQSSGMIMIGPVHCGRHGALAMKPVDCVWSGD